MGTSRFLVTRRRHLENVGNVTVACPSDPVRLDVFQLIFSFGMSTFVFPELPKKKYLA